MSEIYVAITLIVAAASFAAGVIVARALHKCNVEPSFTVQSDGEVYFIADAPQVLVDLEISEEDYEDGTPDWR